MKERTLYTDATTDMETGEVKKIRTITRKNLSQEQFLKLFVEDIGSIVKCSNSEKNIILCMINKRFIDYNTNEIILNADRREQISQCSDIDIRSMNNALYRIIKKNVIIRHNKKLILNPKLFFYGTDLEREKLFELKIKYQLK